MGSLSTGNNKESPSPLLPPIKLDSSNKSSKTASTTILSDSPKDRDNSSVTSTSSSKDTKRMERQFADLLIKYNNILIEFTQLEQEITIKNKTINDQLQQISDYERFLHQVKYDFSKTKDLMEKELIYYKETVEDYQLKFLKLDHELEYYKKLEFNELESYLNQDNDEKYNKLLKDFKVLKSNFELEQNSKIVLMDQIEFLSRENNQLRDQVNSMSENDDPDNHPNMISENHDAFAYSGGQSSSHLHNSIINDLSYNYHVHTSNINEEEEEDEEGHDDDQNPGIEGGNYNYLSGIEAQDQSSPIKESNNPYLFETPRESISKDRIPSLIQTANFQFPPSPDPDSKNKRQSLPVDLQPDFVLSPLKLASQDFDYSNRSQTSSNRPQSNNTNKQNRYSLTRPTHSRYSSHDIVPIKVEFEGSIDQRSTSVPSPKKFDEIEEHDSEHPEYYDNDQHNQELELESTYKKLNGERNSYASSSKRSSLLFENNNHGLGNDLTKQEIMKLKFELQSLKLHNEKLLSYIGFELQKQKKNIKKLSSRQNLRDGGNNKTRKMEYSDSKLIERSRELLIQKKRVLRSVSINTILSKNYNNKDNIGILSKGILPSVKFGEEDDYGFFNFADKFKSRIFSNGLSDYYEDDNYHLDNDNEDDNDNNSDYGDNDEKNPPGRDPFLKKYKSINFERINHSIDDDSNDFEDYSLTSIEEEEDSIDEELEWEVQKRGAKAKANHIGLFSQIKYLLTGSYNQAHPKSTRNDSSVDDSLKYQFFTIAIGIIIIGIRFGHYNHHNQLAS